MKIVQFSAKNAAALDSLVKSSAFNFIMLSNAVVPMTVQTVQNLSGGSFTPHFSVIVYLTVVPENWRQYFTNPDVVLSFLGGDDTPEVVRSIADSSVIKQGDVVLALGANSNSFKGMLSNRTFYCTNSAASQYVIQGIVKEGSEKSEIYTPSFGSSSSVIDLTSSL